MQQLYMNTQQFCVAFEGTLFRAKAPCFWPRSLAIRAGLEAGSLSE